MTKTRFVVECLKDAFRGGWAVANTIASVLTLGGGFVAWQWPVLGGGVNFLMWTIPLGALLLFVYFGSLFAAHRLYEQQAHLASLQFQQQNEQERGRRETIYARLREEYMLSHDVLSPALIADLEAIPPEWINKRLEKLGEKWRV